MTTYSFSIPSKTEYLWHLISSRWSHCSRPRGQRFLGSIQISQEAREQILDVVAKNLRGIHRFTYQNICEKFYEPEKNWLKIFTFALSEYAYSYSSIQEKFWYGFCNKIELDYSQSKENTFRKIVAEGFNLLGVVQAKGGYRYVSTLWLQSGIPQQNLKHFSQLVQEFSNEYGWWEIAHNSIEDISEELFDFCQEKHSQWGTLLNFLKASCPQKDNEQVEAISGQLLQGIAIVAVELERQKTLPEALRNDNEREKLLGNYYLPKNFFLRNWDSLIQVLTPKQRHCGSHRTIFSRRQKPLSLVLDVADSLNIQLILPEQSLWKKEWKDLSGSFCKIPQANWEGTIPQNPGLMIPEQVINIKNEAGSWTWKLLNHQSHRLIDWKLEGIASDFPCLIFDAWTGDRLNLDSANPRIQGTEEIICFTSKDVCLDFDRGIEIVDSCVPSSLRGWRGQHLVLTTKESLINLPFSNTSQIIWQLIPNTQPSLRGLQVKGKKSVYLETPIFWYPPVEQDICLNVSIENLTRRQSVTTNTITVNSSNNWQSFSLNKWISEPGEYEARFWNQSHRYSYKFEIKSIYQIIHQPNISNLSINVSSRGQVNKFPISYNRPDRFWAEEVEIKGLYPLEIVGLSLSDGEETHFSQLQADYWGILRLNLASFYDLLSFNSDWYALDYQRLGEEKQPLIEMKTASRKIAPISWNWNNQEIHFSGLSAEDYYYLYCWNLLLPENPAVEIKIPLISSNDDTITVPLELSPGIYHIKLKSLRQPDCNLGWWCGSNQYDLPDEALENEDLENYCYTVLGDEPVRDFINAAQKFDYEYKLIETIVDSLHNLPYYFPEWLQVDSLSTKLQALFETLKIRLENTNWQYKKKILKEQNTNHNSVVVNNKEWLLIKLTQSKKRSFVEKRIKTILKKYHLQNKVLNIKLPKEWVYKDSILLQCKNIEVLKTHIKSLEFIQIIQPLTSEEALNIS